jgi:hypothetical protein
MRFVGWAFIIVAGLFVGWAIIGGDKSVEESASIDAGALVALRDEGIKAVGWIAGNTSGHPIWPEVRPFVGEGGEYYEFFLTLAPSEANKSGHAAHNVSLYAEWVEIGERAPYDEHEALRRAERIVAISGEIGALLGVRM